MAGIVRGSVGGACINNFTFFSSTFFFLLHFFFPARPLGFLGSPRTRNKRKSVSTLNRFYYLDPGFNPSLPYTPDPLDFTVVFTSLITQEYPTNDLLHPFFLIVYSPCSHYDTASHWVSFLHLLLSAGCLCFLPDGWHCTWVSRSRCACIENYHFYVKPRNGCTTA